MKKLFYVSFSALMATATLSLLSGCGDTQDSTGTTTTTTAGELATQDAAEAEHAHGHGAGPHDGTLADWGGGAYHVEFTVDHDKKESIVYILGSDEKSPAPVKAATVLLSITGPDFQVELAASPLDDEADGMCSRFVGTHDNLGIVQEFQGTISAEVDGTPYVAEFKEAPHGTAGHTHSHEKKDEAGK